MPKLAVFLIYALCFILPSLTLLVLRFILAWNIDEATVNVTVYGGALLGIIVHAICDKINEK